MPLHQDLLDLLACPLTRQPIRVAEPPLVETVNQRIARGECTNAGGKKVEEPLAEALVTADGKRLYPVRDGIPVMLVDECIVL